MRSKQSDVSNFRRSNFVPNASAIATSTTRNALHKVVARVNSRLFAFTLPRVETRGMRGGAFGFTMRLIGRETFASS